VGIYNSFYWSINPESGDTYGIFTTPYDPVSNTSGWGTWSGTDSRKLDLLAKLWNATGTGTIAKHGTIKKVSTFHVLNTGLITYSLPAAAFVSLKIYDCNGRLQSEIIGKQQEAGFYSINRRHMSSAAGSYVAVFKAGEYLQKQMVCFTK
jgi:hypothetical protein